MAVNNQRPRGNFIKPILPRALEAKKLDLPANFVNLYGSELSSTAELALPNGAVWTVGVERGRDAAGRLKVRFSRGWDAFVTHHSISLGFFLRLDYRGGSKFYVKIFDLSTCQAMYFFPETGRTGVQNLVSDDDDVDGEGDDDDYNDDDDDDDDDDDADEQSGREIQHLLKRAKVNKIAISIRLRTILSEHKSLKAFKDAIESKPKHPSFILAINDKMLGNNTKATVPHEFAKNHGLDSGRAVADLWANGKKWAVNLMFNNTNSMTYLSGGWIGFCQANGLGAGDVCLFELVSEVNRMMPVIRVSVFRAEQ